MENSSTLFNKKVLGTLRSLIELHHSIYPRIPPQGIFFESLVEHAFKQSGWPANQVILSTTNTPKHDLLVGDNKISLKTETGAGTNASFISITKLCTTETGGWDSNTLIQHTLNHLSRYDYMLMLRAIWHHDIIHYQIVEIYLTILKSIAQISVLPVGRRAGRQSMAADVDVYDQSQRMFRVHFDGADGKCQIHKLPISLCQLLLEWDQSITE